MRVRWRGLTASVNVPECIPSAAHWSRAFAEPHARGHVAIETNPRVDAPHDVLLVLDGSTGQNAFEQAKQFTAATEVTSLAVTKLDGTAKGGVVIGISDQFQIPVKYIGVGEGIEDLQVFNKY